MKPITNIPITKLHAFEGHPYKVLDNEEMNALIGSIQENGILTPLLVRPLEGTTDEYEVISGHRRLHAAQKAGLETVPAFIHAIDRDAASILLVDSNLHREHILPSEKAFAYKLKMEAMNRQGQRTFSQVGKKINSYEEMAGQIGESRNQIHRYIRLTQLSPKLLDLVDQGRIAFSVGVELSYLPDEAQNHLAEIIDRDEATPSYSQAVRMHKEENESAGGRRGWVLPLRYELKDGRTVTRLYNVINDERSQADPDSDLRHYETLSNLPECIDRRVMKHRTLTEADFLNAYVQVQLYDEVRGGWRGQELTLTREQAIELYRTAILPDAEQGNIGRFFVYGTPDRDELMSNVTITMELTPDPDPAFVERDAGPYYYADRSWLDLNVLMSSENTRRWLEENLGVTAENQHGLEAAIPARVYA